MNGDTIIAGYHVVRRLGQGGMGTVYLVQNPVLPRRDALKVLSAELSYNRDFRARFIREADLASQLTHPNIVSIYTRGQTPEGQLWIAMEFVDGVDADAALRAGTMTPVRAVHIAGEVAKALDYAHRRNIVHRDVKPANFLLAGDPGEDERVLLGDFGIARALDDVGLTVSGSVLATVAYAAPEVLAGDPFDARADVYSLGCTLFRMLTGKTPFADAHGMAAVMVAHLEQPPPRVTDRAPSLPSGLNEVIATALAKDPARRFQTARELASAAAAAVNDRTTPHAVAWRPLPGGEVASYPRTPGSPPPWWRYASGPSTQLAPPVAPPPGPARPGQLSLPVPPTPAPRNPARRTLVARRWMVGAAVAVAVLLVGGLTAALTHSGRDQHGAAGDPNTSTGQPAPSSGQPAPSTASAAPVPAAAPTDLQLLSPDEVSAIMITPGLQFRVNQNALLDDSPEIDAKDCVGAWMAAQKVAYDGTGWNVAGVQSLGEPQKAMWDLGVVQALVGFPSPELAQKFFADQGALWTACANRTVTVTPPDQSPVQTWTFGTPRNVDAMLTITYHQGSNGGGCQRALTVRGNTAIDVTACDSDPMIENRAGTIAGNIAAKAP